MSYRILKILLPCALLAVMASPARGQLLDKKIVHLELKGPVSEVPDSNPFNFGFKEQLTTKTLLERLKRMRTDQSVAAVYITFENPSMGLAQMQELRRAIEQLKMTEKEVYVHLDACYSTGLYWLASSASKIAMVPTGDLWVTGLYGERLYLKDLLENIRVDADVIHIGEFKNALEPLTRNEPSEATAEMDKWLFDDLYRQMLEQIAESRSLKVTDLERLIDNGPYTAEQANEVGLVDEVAYRMDFVNQVKERHGDLPFDRKYGQGDKMELDLANPWTMMQKIFGDIMAGPKEEDETPSVALIYVAGTIIPGEGDEGPFGGVSHGASSRLRKALYKAAYDDNIKAVVMRVDSPGGSAVASEIIWHATQEVAANKPFVVSMGNVAGSGGYYVSCGADTIFAEPATITGSIGAVSGKLITKGMWEWMGVHWHPIQRGKNADIFASDKPFTEEHRAKIRGWMEEVCEVFKSRILAKREGKLSKPLEELAGGRVYTGAQALELGLVDKLGGLQDALKHAALQANLGDDYRVKILPKPKNLMDILMEQFGMETRLNTPASLADSSLYKTVLPILNTLEPQKAQAMIRMLQRIELLKNENVLLVMPSEIVIH